MCFFPQTIPPNIQSPPQLSIEVPLPFSEGDWIPRVYHIQSYPSAEALIVKWKASIRR